LFPFIPNKLLTPIILQWYLFAIYEAPNETIQDTIHRDIQHCLPCKLRYVSSNHNPLNIRSLGSIAGSIIVSIKASQNALCSNFSSFPSNQDCKWGGIAITLPWVTAIFGGYQLFLSRYSGKLIFGSLGAGGLVCIVAEKQVGPVEVLRKEVREDLERLQRDWLNGCYEENLKRCSYSIDSEGEEPEAGPSDNGFDPYVLANVAYPEGIHAPRQTIPMDLWRYDPGSLLPRRHGATDEDAIDDGDDLYAEDDQYEEPRLEVQYHDAYPDTMSVSQPDTEELNDVLDIRSLVYFPPGHPTVEDVHSATANLSDLNSNLLGRLTPSDAETSETTPEATVEETSCWEDDGTDEGEEVVAKKTKKKKLRPRRLDSGSIRPQKKFVVRFEDPPSTREPLTIIVTPPTPLPNKGFF